MNTYTHMLTHNMNKYTRGKNAYGNVKKGKPKIAALQFNARQNYA